MSHHCFSSNYKPAKQTGNGFVRSMIAVIIAGILLALSI